MQINFYWVILYAGVIPLYSHMNGSPVGVAGSKCVQIPILGSSALG